jgi:hypothetical protein
MSQQAKQKPDADVVVVTAHPPERGRQGATVTLACGCCCCCCCCLHTVGSAVGGLVGSMLPIKARPKINYDPSAPFPFRRDEFWDEEEIMFSPTLMYWLMVSVLTTIGSVWFFVQEGTFKRPEYLLYGFLLAAIGFLPAIQLGASLLTCILVAVFYTDKRTAFIRVGKITLWSVVGTLIGTGIMLGLCVALTGGSVLKDIF